MSEFSDTEAEPGRGERATEFATHCKPVCFYTQKVRYPYKVNAHKEFIKNA